MSKVLLATSLGPGKEYAIPLLLDLLPQLQDVADILITCDGVPFPSILCAVNPSKVLTLSSPAPEISIHGRLARMREAQRRAFLRGDWTHLYWHDSDMVPPVDAIPLMLARNTPVVSGAYLIRGKTEVPTLAIVVNETPNPDPNGVDVVNVENDAFPAIAAGMGCMLVDRTTLQRVSFRSPHWYGQDGPGEDIQWCKDLGHSVLIDTCIRPWHVDSDGNGIRAAMEVTR